MNPQLLAELKRKYNFSLLSENDFKIYGFDTGLINNTWKVITPENDYILQRINETVFKKPVDIANNISLVSAYLKQHQPGYKFVASVVTIDGEEMIHVKGEGFFRLFPFISCSHSKDVVQTSDEAYEAATQFGRFTRLLSGIDVSRFKITIPGFHDLDLRYEQFLSALEKGNQTRIKESAELIKSLHKHSDIVAE